MTDKTNPRAEFDRALAAMRYTKHIDSTARVTLATVACAEALSLLVDAQVAATGAKPKPEPVEPPEGSVVLVGGEAWQRVGNRWYAVGEEAALQWADTLLWGTPTVIHTPEVS